VRRRFFVDQFSGRTAIVEGETARHLGRVLRAQTGQVYELSDGDKVWLGRIEKVARDRVEFSLVEQIPAHQPRIDIALLLAVVKFDAFEWAIEKATELGVSTIVPLAGTRSEKALLFAAPKRAARWKKILAEASQQSRRVRVPMLQPLQHLDAALNGRTDKLRIMLSERAEAPALCGALTGERPVTVALAIGPEGGWTEGELDAAKRAGFRDASLGPLILRTETAVVAALACINYAYAE
jgi:16S rRNA (uracil1498-N3)-methyltransferase